MTKSLNRKKIDNLPKIETEMSELKKEEEIKIESIIPKENYDDNINLIKSDLKNLREMILTINENMDKCQKSIINNEKSLLEKINSHEVEIQEFKLKNISINENIEYVKKDDIDKVINFIMNKITTIEDRDGYIRTEQLNNILNEYATIKNLEEFSQAVIKLVTKI